MIAIFRKEINAFFSSLIGYLVIAVFLLVMGLFLFVFPETSLLDFGYASLGPFFTLAPNVLTFIIPAICMRAFAEERQTGAIELLVTRPLRDVDIVLGKFLACLTLVVIALLPTALYYYTIYQLGAPVGNIDAGGTIGSYLGLLFLAMAFVSIGLFASSLTSNQIVSFLLALALTFWCYFGFDLLASLPVFYLNGESFIASLGMQDHFRSLGRGLIDSRDVVYFLSVTAFFLLLTVISLERRKW
ncbi:gliding motility-associated ABC transporter permease subunit GldF [Neolewinella lacunae]|uniref:Gliding motility-associated ABC transporter permease subunit GldF n=1 Tax=Neolewinella lacunae TaxID=1517758 RepID=A0A923PS64_9BACT|nr:gliding motility-associated ABC transporter permease subunit GldF [Neolewinella lacunae]MBC6996498.1 gliding motility-associated ABC transporter permease subunit GldF [Neolewinella lacunae]MDN3636651.1 gliding motility-associated ABC transporter permease subunit GldF [Neolewinella lacunae]